jgi:hypothetical protein
MVFLRLLATSKTLFRAAVLDVAAGLGVEEAAAFAEALVVVGGELGVAAGRRRLLTSSVKLTGRLLLASEGFLTRERSIDGRGVVVVVEGGRVVRRKLSGRMWTGFSLDGSGSD